MSQSFVKHMVLFVLLVFVQVFVVQQLYFFYFIPLLYIYALLCWPIKMPVYWVLILGFLLGLTVDIFSDTLGMNAFACTMAAIMRLPSFRLATENGVEDDIRNIDPGEKTMGFYVFWKYAVLMVLIHHTALFLVESFSLFDVGMLLLRILGSSLLTLVLIFFAERFR